MLVLVIGSFLFGALQYTIEQARNEAIAAKNAIAALDDNEYRQAMMFLAEEQTIPIVMIPSPT